MTTLIGWAILIWLAYEVGRLVLGAGRTRNPVLSRLNLDTDDLMDMPGEEALERELTRQLFAGRVDPATYRCELSRLAHGSADPAGEHRTIGDDGHPGHHSDNPETAK